MDVDVLIMGGLWHCGASKNYHQRQNLTDELLGLLHKPQLIPSCAKPNSYPLVMTYTKPWKITILNGKTHISMAIFNSYVTNYQRVSIPNETVGKNNPLSSHIKNTCVVLCAQFMAVYHSNHFGTSPVWSRELAFWTVFHVSFGPILVGQFPETETYGAMMDPAPSCNLGSISPSWTGNWEQVPSRLVGKNTEIFGKDSKGTHQRLLQDSWISDPNIS